jgi:hypothetical protein
MAFECIIRSGKECWGCGKCEEIDETIDKQLEKEDYFFDRDRDEKLTQIWDGN